MLGLEIAPRRVSLVTFIAGQRLSMIGAAAVAAVFGGSDPGRFQ